MNIVITGANGYIGSRLSWYLAEKGHFINAVCYPNIPEDTEWVKKIDKKIVGDLRKIETIKQITDLNADVLIHLVSLDHYASEDDPDMVNAVNVTPTWNLLHSCTRKGLKKFIYFSTIHVYGKNQQDVLTEDRTPSPFNSYGLTHLLSEEIVNKFNRSTNTECINLRLSNSFGEPILHDVNCWDIVVNNLCQSAVKENKIILKGDGSPLRDFIHYETICDSVNKLLSVNLELERNTIHLSSGASYSMLELAFFIKDVFETRNKCNINVFINSNDLVHNFNLPLAKTIVSNDYLKKLISFNSTSLENGINGLLTYLESQQQ